jgi:hypothetical protein
MGSRFRNATNTTIQHANPLITGIPARSCDVGARNTSFQQRVMPLPGISMNLLNVREIAAAAGGASSRADAVSGQRPCFPQQMQVVVLTVHSYYPGTGRRYFAWKGRFRKWRIGSFECC